MGKPLEIKQEILNSLTAKTQNLKTENEDNNNIKKTTELPSEIKTPQNTNNNNNNININNINNIAQNLVFNSPTPEIPVNMGMQPQILYNNLRNEGAYSADFLNNPLQKNLMNPMSSNFLDNMNYNAFTNQQIMNLQMSLDPMNQLQMGLMTPNITPLQQIIQPIPMNSNFQGQTPSTSTQISSHLHKLSKTPEPTNHLAGITEKSQNNQNAPTSININEEIDASNVPEETQNRLIFLLNNLDITRMDEKINELRMLLENDQTQKWFAKILVYKRAAQENINLSTMLTNYCIMLAKINRKSLFNYVLKETYTCIHKYLNMPPVQSDKTSQRKNVLKNLGSWLGQLTLKREKPIILKHLNLKNLLFDACQNNKLPLVLPLVCKILEQSKETMVFKPKNPWLSVILGLLCEIKSLTEIKTSVCLEIQLLFMNLGIEEKQIQPTDFFSPGKLNQKLISMVNQGKAPIPNVFPAQKPIQPFVQPVNRPTSTTEAPANNLLSPPTNNYSAQLKIAQLPEYITIDDKNLSMYIDMGINLKLIVAQAVETAIKEIIPPVVSRSVTIALITTRQLALKDFALEPDERKILKGTNLIVQSLSGSLALVTCREPLRVALSSYLKEYLNEQTSLGEEDIDKIVQISSLDNLDLGCALIKKAVIERALEDVNNDQIILEILKKRRIAREKGEAYYDENYLRMTQFLPEPLRPLIRGLTDEQLKIYEDFGNNPKKITQSTSSQNFSNNQINNRNLTTTNKRENDENVNL